MVDHVTVRSGNNYYVLECARCKAGRIVPIPVEAKLFVKIAKEFGLKHVECKEGSDAGIR